jgi:hypothetical protein
LNLPFDSYKTQGEIRDYSTYENNGTLGGGDNNKAPIWKGDCQVGGCYEFSESGEYIQFDNEVTLSLDSSALEFWVNSGTVPSEVYADTMHFFSRNSIYLNYVGITATNYLRMEGTTNSDYWVIWDMGDIRGSWKHIVVSADEGNVSLYVDGDYKNSWFPVSDVILSRVSNPLTNNNGSWFNGSIDETKIYSRALSPEQIKANYQAGLNGKSPETLVSQETDKGDIWRVAMTSNDAFYDSETVLSNELEIVNDAPDDPEDVTLVSVDGTNESDADLDCSAYVEDLDNEFLDVYVNWFKDGDSVLNQTFIDWENGTVFNTILDEGNLTLGDVWYCSVRTYDSSDYSNWVDSNELEIIDITDPIVNIISPEPINYSVLNVSFNVSVIENENVSMCFYDLDYEGNVSMNELNDSYFWSEPSLGPGFHEVWFYCNDTSGNWGMNYTNFTIENEAAIAILLSEELMQQVRWNVLSLPIDDLDAIGNNGDNATDYYVNISATNTLVDLYVKADGDLFNSGGDSIGLGNETFGVSMNDSTVSNVSTFVMNTSYILIGSSIGDNATVYMKFYLDAPSSQAAGQYLNQLDFKAVREGEAP